MYDFHLFTSCVFFLLRTKQTPFFLHFPCFRMLNVPPTSFVCVFSHLSFSREEHATVFTKLPVTRDHFETQMSTDLYWKHHELTSDTSLFCESEPQFWDNPYVQGGPKVITHGLPKVGSPRTVFFLQFLQKILIFQKNCVT